MNSNSGRARSLECQGRSVLTLAFLVLFIAFELLHPMADRLHELHHHQCPDHQAAQTLLDIHSASPDAHDPCTAARTSYGNTNPGPDSPFLVQEQPFPATTSLSPPKPVPIA